MRMIRIYNLLMVKSDSLKAKYAGPPGDSKVAHASQSNAGQPGIARITSRQLFDAADEVEIEHNGILYRLRRTSLGKLILTK